METTKIVADPECRIGTVDRRLFGSFIEHLGRAVYTGICRPRSPCWPLSLNVAPRVEVPRHREGLKRVGDLAILSYAKTKAKDHTRRLLWEPSSNPNHDAMMIVPHDGIAPDARNSSISIASCKLRGSPCVKPPRRLICPVARCRHGGRLRKAFTNIPPSWPFSPVPHGWPACLVWGSGYPPV